jgi:uncharacterized protein with LGFP repeats
MVRPTSTGYAQAFQGGMVTYTSASGIHTVPSPMVAGYSAIGGPASAYGYPTAEAVTAGSGLKLPLQHGTLWYSAATGAHPTSGPIQTYWLGRGGPASSLGFPTSAVTSTATDDTQSFATAMVRYVKATGLVVIIRRS